jgi:hypothetical protein
LVTSSSSFLILSPFLPISISPSFVLRGHRLLICRTQLPAQRSVLSPSPQRTRLRRRRRSTTTQLSQPSTPLSTACVQKRLARTHSWSQRPRSLPPPRRRLPLLPVRLLLPHVLVLSGAHRRFSASRRPEESSASSVVYACLKSTQVLS